jgi:hypothetical protein
MVFKPLKSTGLAFGLAAIMILVGAEVSALAFLRGASLSFLAFLALCFFVASLPILSFIGYRCYGLALGRYVLSRNALVVEWGGRRELVPLEKVTEVRAVTEPTEVAALQPSGFTWPGCLVGRAQLPGLGRVEFLAATDAHGLVSVRYEGGCLVLSPPDPLAFAQTFARLQAEGPSAKIEPESITPGFQRWSLWRDRPALAVIAGGGVSELLLMGYLLLVYPTLPAEVALHFTVQGQPDRFGAPLDVFILPIISGLTWALNTLLGLWLRGREGEHPLAHLLFGASLLVQALVWVAALRLVAGG